MAAEPAPSTVGIALAAASVAIMPTLSWFERRTGRELGSASVVADSKQTLICARLSGVLLLGLAANAAFGWSWADPVVALVIAAVAVREGFGALRGNTCCSPPAVLLHERKVRDLPCDESDGPDTRTSDDVCACGERHAPAESAPSRPADG